MRERDRKPPAAPKDDEFIDTLITVSVIAKRLAEKLRAMGRRPLHTAATEPKMNGG